MGNTWGDDLAAGDKRPSPRSEYGLYGLCENTVRIIYLFLRCLFISVLAHVQWCASILRRCMSMVPPRLLQVDIYVTNFKPVPAKLPAIPSPSLSSSRLHLSTTPATNEEFPPPHPKFARNGTAHLRSNSLDSVDSHDTCESDVDFGYYGGEQSDDDVVPEDLSLAHETNILGLTNFHDEEDIFLPGERNLSIKVRTEGKLRRLQTRRGKMTGFRKDSETGLATTFLQSHHDYAPHSFRQSVLSTHSTDRSIPVSPLSECRPITSESDHTVSPVQRFSEAFLWPRPHSGHSTHIDYPTVSLITPAALPAVRGRTSQGLGTNSGGKSEAESSRHSMPPQVVTHKPPDSVGFEIDEQEINDMDVVSEHVRPGKPKLQKMIADEVERSGGSVVVACESDRLSFSAVLIIVVERLWAIVTRCASSEDSRQGNKS